MAGGMRDAAAAGRLNVVNRIAAAVAPWRLAFHEASEANRLLAPARSGWTLLHRQEPFGGRGLVLREAYHPPFWRIEGTAERWRFDVARAAYDPDAVDPDAARPWARRWRGRLGVGDAARGGFVLVPLQGRLLDHRSFQSMSPVAMIEAALARDPRPHVATLHPREGYGADEAAALDALARRFPRFSWRVGGTAALLASCDHVVTMNSAVAFDGFWAAKRAVLFGLIDFHHVAGSVPRDGIEAAFASLAAPEPDWDRYLWWFWQGQAINMGAPDAEARVRARLVSHGVPLEAAA